MGSLLEPSALSSMVRSWLKEDVPSFDYGGLVVGDSEKTAVLLAKSSGTFAGRPFVDAVFKELDCRVDWYSWVEEGMEIMGPFPVKIAEVSGPARNILLGERVALNTIARCSGVATRSKQLMDIARGASWKGAVAGTRKTTPGFRLVEKYGMVIGGADTHRMDLSSMVMLKDNHIKANGSIKGAVVKAKAFAGFALKIEVECSTFEEADEAAQAGADIVMLDNFKPAHFRETAALVRSKHPHVLIEGSGGLSASTLSDYFCPEANILSLSIAQGASFVDFSLKLQ